MLQTRILRRIQSSNNFIINFLKQTMKLQISKRSLSNSIKAVNHPKKNKPNLLNVYGSNKKDNKAQKLKSFKCMKKKSVSDYQFPEFAIVFKEKGKDSTFNSYINNQMQNSKAQASNKSLTKKKNEKKTKLVQGKTNAKQNKEQEQSNQDESFFTNYTFNNNLNFQRKSPFESEYLKCIQKIFNILDIFNKGKISETNINKWLPEPALYFLGKVFQKIRSERLSLNYLEFENLCCILLNEASSQDIEWFIGQINSTSTLKKSVDLPEKEIIQLTPIQKRILEGRHLKNRFRQKQMYKNKPSQSLVIIMKAKEVQKDQKLFNAKEKGTSPSFNIQEQKKVNYEQSSPQKHFFEKGHQSGSWINKRNYEESQSKDFPFKRSILKQSCKREQPTFPKNVSPNILEVQLQKCGIPSFTFHLPLLDQEIQPNQLEVNQMNDKFSQIYRKYKGKLQKNSAMEIREPFSARYQSNFQPQVKSQKRIESAKKNFNEDDKRLEKLKSRIQGFLKQNTQKINNNRSFYLQNCPNQQ